MNFVDKQFINNYFKNKRVALFGSAPSCLNNKGDHINKYDIIVRVNNYKIKGFEKQVGNRTDVHYSFYGSSIKKTKEDLIVDGVNLCMCKCPNSFVVDHSKMVDWDPKNIGGDFTPIYRRRSDFWFCDTYIPTKDDFMEYFNLMDSHMPTTGFSCILDLISSKPKELYITGFDGFKSKIHNVNEKWIDKSHRIDPICHQPALEMELLTKYNKKYDYIKLDRTLNENSSI